MDSFYTTVVIIAVILLILCLIAVGVMLQKSGEEKPFPAQNNPCPDGWGVNEKGNCILPTNNVNTTTADKLVSTSGKTTDDIWEKIGSHYKIKDSASICDKKKWANDNVIIWDGISNYNQCVK
jgi:predicted metalloprotease